LHLFLALAPVSVLQVAVLKGVVVPRTSGPLYRILVRIFNFPVGSAGVVVSHLLEFKGYSPGMRMRISLASLSASRAAVLDLPRASASADNRSGRIEIIKAVNSSGKCTI